MNKHIKIVNSKFAVKMPVLGQPKFLTWEETAHINFEGNGNNGTKRQVSLYARLVRSVAL